MSFYAIAGLTIVISLYLFKDELSGLFMRNTMAHLTLDEIFSIIEKRATTVRTSGPARMVIPLHEWHVIKADIRTRDYAQARMQNVSGSGHSSAQAGSQQLPALVQEGSPPVQGAVAGAVAAPGTEVPPDSAEDAAGEEEVTVIRQAPDETFPLGVQPIRLLAPPVG